MGTSLIFCHRSPFWAPQLHRGSPGRWPPSQGFQALPLPSRVGCPPPWLQLSSAPGCPRSQPHNAGSHQTDFFSFFPSCEIDTLLTFVSPFRMNFFALISKFVARGQGWFSAGSAPQPQPRSRCPTNRAELPAEGSGPNSSAAQTACLHSASAGVTDLAPVPHGYEGESGPCPGDPPDLILRGAEHSRHPVTSQEHPAGTGPDGTGEDGDAGGSMGKGKHLSAEQHGQ